jgi:predicted transcriptional regulator
VNVLRQEKKIADLIKRHMQSHHLTTGMFAKQSNLSSLSLQSILFGRLPNMIELDHLTTAMGMQTGDLYVLYEIQLRKLKFTWPKTFRYLIHCAKKSLHEHLISGVKHCYTMKNASVRLLHLAEYL